MSTVELYYHSCIFLNYYFIYLWWLAINYSLLYYYCFLRFFFRIFFSMFLMYSFISLIVIYFYHFTVSLLYHIFFNQSVLNVFFSPLTFSKLKQVWQGATSSSAYLQWFSQNVSLPQMLKSLVQNRCRWMGMLAQVWLFILFILYILYL